MKKLILLLLLFFCETVLFSQNGHENMASKVPRFTFSNTIEDQRRELSDNLLIERFKLSRKKLSVDKHRPYYHFINPEGQLNDPNGLCYWQGNWHLFYQAYPPEDPRQHWGHAVSKDIIHWEDLPYAIYPNPEERVFSGSTFVEKDRVIAMYHGVGQGSMIATSTDPLLLNWKKLDENPVIPIAKSGETLPYNVYDPFIWGKGDYYFTLQAGTRPVGPGGKNMRANFLLRSRNLIEWEYVHPFVENDHYSLVGDDGACPYFWPIGTKGKYILLYFSHKSGGKYLIGDYDKDADKFYVTDGGNFNHGPRNDGGVHAPSAFPDGKGGVVVIFNMNSGKEISEGNFTQLMTLPRLLTLDDNDKLQTTVTGNIQSLRGEKISMGEKFIPANKEYVFKKISGNALEMDIVIDLRESPLIELNVLRSPDKKEYTRILFYKNGGYYNREYPGRNEKYSAISIDNSKSSISPKVRPRVVETADVDISDDKFLNLRVFIDKSVVEVFVNNKQCISLRAYPELENSKGVSIYSHGKGTLIKSMDVWEMKNIYHN